MTNSTQTKLKKDLEHAKSMDQSSPGLLLAKERLEEDLEREKDKRLEERFIWILCLTLVLDVIIFANITHIGGSLVIGALEILGLMILGKRMGIEEVSEFIDKLTKLGNGA